MSAEDSPKKNLTRSTLSAFGWQYTSIIAQALLQLVVLAVLSRLLSPDDFGVLGFALIFVGFAALFSQMGVGPALIQRAELTTEHVRVGFTLSMLLSLGFTALLAAAAPLAGRFMAHDQVIQVLRVVSLNFLFTGLGVVSEALLKRDLKFKKLMWANILSYLFGYAAPGILLAWMGFGVWALVGATLGQSLLHSVLLLVYRPHPLAPSLARREAGELLFFGGGLTPAHFLNYTAHQGDYFVVGRLAGAGPLGIYTRAYQLMMLPAKYFGQVLTVVLFPVMARMQHSRGQLVRTYLSGIAVVTLVSAPLSVLMVVLAPEIVSVVLGPQWVETVLPFQILALGVVARSSYKIDDALARALGVMYQRSVRDGIYAAGVILGSLAGLRWGLPGVACGVLAAVLLNYLLAMQMSRRLLELTWGDILRALLPALYPALAAGVVAVGVPALLRPAGAPDWFTLGIAGLLSAGALLALYAWRPQILGPYGLATLRRLLPWLPVRRVPESVSRWLEARLENG